MIRNIFVYRQRQDSGTLIWIHWFTGSFFQNDSIIFE